MVLKFKTLRDFTDHLDHNGPRFPLKVMGEARPNVDYTATMLAAVYTDTPDPDRTALPTAVTFGTLGRRGCTLNAAEAYSQQIVAASDGSNTFQGDIIGLPVDLRPLGGPGVSQFAMLVSHSCDMGAGATASLCPVFREQDLDQPFVDFLKGKPTKNVAGEVQNLLKNEQHRFLGLPAHSNKNFPDQLDEPLLVWLGLVVSASRQQVRATPTQLRLTYRANSYLQSRLAVMFMRDVQRSDETRDF